MFRMQCEVQFCYGHRLLHYDGKCRFLHGHNGRAIVAFETGDADAVTPADLRDAERIIDEWIDDTLDHRMLLHRDDPVVPLMQQLGEPIVLLDTNPTAENIAKLIFEFARQLDLPVIEAQLWETSLCYAAYGPGKLAFPRSTCLTLAESE